MRLVRAFVVGSFVSWRQPKARPTAFASVILPTLRRGSEKPFIKAACPRPDASDSMSCISILRQLHCPKRSSQQMTLRTIFPFELRSISLDCVALARRRGCAFEYFFPLHHRRSTMAGPPSLLWVLIAALLALVGAQKPEHKVTDFNHLPARLFFFDDTLVCWVLSPGFHS